MDYFTFNKLPGDIRMRKIDLYLAENILKTFKYKWIYIKFLSQTNDKQSVVYSKFKIKYISIDDSEIILYGTEDNDRLIINKEILVQAECTFKKDEIRFIQSSNDTFNDFYIKDYLPTSNLRFEEITHSTKNLIITEGKTDWKHLKHALNKFKLNGEYKYFDFDFFEYDNNVEMCNSTLLTICKYQALFKNEHLKVFIFDSDDPIINKEHEDNQIKYYGNNVYSLILPIPPHRKHTPLISIENYYTDDEIKTLDSNGRRLFIANEFDKEGKHLTIDNVYALDVNHNTCVNHIVDNKVFKILDNNHISKKDIFNYNNKINIALSKNAFAEYILNNVKPFDKISIDNFRLIFNVISQISNSNSNSNIIEIDKGIYIEDIDGKKVLHIYGKLTNNNINELKNYNNLKCNFSTSPDNSTLFFNIEAKTFSFNIPIPINENLKSFILLKSENFSNRIELHLYNEKNILVYNTELLSGENTSNLAMSIILKLVL